MARLNEHMDEICREAGLRRTKVGFGAVIDFKTCVRDILSANPDNAASGVRVIQILADAVKILKRSHFVNFAMRELVLCNKRHCAGSYQNMRTM